MVQKQANELQTLQDYLENKRGSLQLVENQDIELYRISTANKVVVDSLPYKQGFQNYLNNILLLNMSTPDQLQLSLGLIPGSPFIPANFSTQNNTLMQRELYYNLAN